MYESPQKVEVNIYAGKHQRALREGSQQVLTLSRAPPKIEEKRNNRLMRIQWVVSHAIQPASSPPKASRSTSNPPIRSPLFTVVVVELYFVYRFYGLVQAFYCMAV